MPVYAGPIQVDSVATGGERRGPRVATGGERRGPRIERRVSSPQPALASDSRLTRFLRSLWTEEQDEIELRARRAAKLARERH